MEIHMAELHDETKSTFNSNGWGLEGGGDMNGEQDIDWAVECRSGSAGFNSLFRNNICN